MKTLQPREHGELSLVADNPFPAVTYSHRQAEAIVLFNLNALAEIANTKNNLIGVRFHQGKGLRVLFCLFVCLFFPRKESLGLERGVGLPGAHLLPSSPLVFWAN